MSSIEAAPAAAKAPQTSVAGITIEVVVNVVFNRSSTGRGSSKSASSSWASIEIAPAVAKAPAPAAVADDVAVPVVE